MTLHTCGILTLAGLVTARDGASRPQSEDLRSTSETRLHSTQKRVGIIWLTGKESTHRNPREIRLQRANDPQSHSVTNLHKRLHGSSLGLESY